MHITPDATNTQIVLLGNFDPPAFRPEVLFEKKLIGDSQLKAAQIRIAHEALVDANIDWFRLLVTQERFILTATEAPWIRLHDFCARMFVETYPEAKIKMMGINRSVWFETGGIKQRDRLGSSLAPRSAWGEWGQRLDSSRPDGVSGLSSLTMRQEHGLEDRKKGYIEVRIAPADTSKVLMTVNDHYEAVDEEKATQEIMNFLRNNFEHSIARSDWIVDCIMQQVK